MATTINRSIAAGSVLSTSRAAKLYTELNVTRLTTGKRINWAMDDAAGLNVSSWLRLTECARLRLNHFINIFNNLYLDYDILANLTRLRRRFGMIIATAELETRRNKAMTIYKSSDFLEVYRAKATSKHINELSGRTGRPDLTDFVSRDILNRLPLCSGSILVDVGCGNGRLLEFAAENKVDSFNGRLIGILPTIEEAARLRNHFLETLSCKLISIEVGEVTETNIPDNYADCVVCNGVLLLLQDEQRVRNAISEITRITKPGGTVYIGEIPSKDEMQDKSYDDSIIRWLIWTLKNQGFSNFIHRVRQVFSALTTSEPFIIAPKKVYFSSSNEFIILLESYNLQVINHFHHRLTDSEGSIIECSSRWSYECVKSH